MNFQKMNDHSTGDLIFVVRISQIEMLETTFDTFDMMLKKECEESGSVADKVLFLELLTRKVEHAQAAKPKKLRIVCSLCGKDWAPGGCFCQGVPVRE